MNSTIRIIKRNHSEEPLIEQNREREKSVEQNTRDIVVTVKSWILEAQQRKRAEHKLLQNRRLCLNG